MKAGLPSRFVRHHLDFYCDEVAAALPVAGDVRIGEVHRDPSAVADTAGEYFELVNVSVRPGGLLGVTLSDNAASVTLASNSCSCRAGRWGSRCRSERSR